MWARRQIVKSSASAARGNKEHVIIDWTVIAFLITIRLNL